MAVKFDVPPPVCDDGFFFASLFKIGLSRAKYHAGAESAVFLKVAARQTVLTGVAAGGVGRIRVDTRPLVRPVAVLLTPRVVAGTGQGAVRAQPE